MSIRKLKEETGYIYFSTFTCYQWIHLFEKTNFYDRIYNWFDFLSGKKIQIISYVIMPNHFHGLIFLPETAPTINKVIGEGKRFMSYPLITRLEEQKEEEILEKLKSGVTEKEKLKGIKHKVFEPSFDAKPCFTDEFVHQKLNYIHNNPVSKKWKLAETPEDYIHSSAKYYLTGEQGIYPVVDYRDAGVYEE
jgi:REP element-mobilizing transposase RayT